MKFHIETVEVSRSLGSIWETGIIMKFQRITFSKFKFKKKMWTWNTVHQPRISLKLVIISDVDKWWNSPKKRNFTHLFWRH